MLQWNTPKGQRAFTMKLYLVVYNLLSFIPFLIRETMKTVLTEREQLCVRRIVLEGWTAESLAVTLGISKQAVNQCKKRALEKLKKIYT